MRLPVRDALAIAMIAETDSACSRCTQRRIEMAGPSLADYHA